MNSRPLARPLGPRCMRNLFSGKLYPWLIRQSAASECKSDNGPLDQRVAGSSPGAGIQKSLCDRNFSYFSNLALARIKRALYRFGTG
jgi:hypothetical protein